MAGDAAVAGHVFCDRLLDLLWEAEFDAFGEEVCKPYYAPRTGRRHCRRAGTSDAHDRLIRRHLLRLSNVEKAPDHSWLSHTRSGLPHGRSASR